MTFFLLNWRQNYKIYNKIYAEIKTFFVKNEKSVIKMTIFVFVVNYFLFFSNKTSQIKKLIKWKD